MTVTAGHFSWNFAIHVPIAFSCAVEPSPFSVPLPQFTAAGAADDAAVTAGDGDGAGADVVTGAGSSADSTVLSSEPHAASDSEAASTSPATRPKR